MVNKLILILLLFSVIVIYLLSSSGPTPYNYFVLLADQFLKGNYYLTDSMPWLNELIPLKNGGYGVVYPPAPSILLAPLVHLFGTNFNQNYLSYFMGAILALTTAKITYHETKSLSHFYWMVLLASFGNISWYLSSNGSVWYLGQISGAFFLTLTIYESITRRRPTIVAILFTMAIFSRLQLILAFPLITVLNYKGINIKRFAGYIFPITIGVLLYLYYNYLRFGNAFETGYSLIPGVLDEPWYSKGIFHLSYIQNNIDVFLLSKPILTPVFPYIKPSWAGLSVLITTPAFIYIFRNNLKDKVVFFAFISIFLVALVNFSHGGTGFTQFGYRYAVDFYPILFLLVSKYLNKKELRYHHYILLAFSIIINLWGVIWINKFDWVSF